MSIFETKQFKKEQLKDEISFLKQKLDMFIDVERNFNDEYNAFNEEPSQEYSLSEDAQQYRLHCLSTPPIERKESSSSKAPKVRDPSQSSKGTSKNAKNPKRAKVFESTKIQICLN